MLKALIKKQFSEIFAMYLIDNKTGKIRSKKSTVMFIGLFVIMLLWISTLFYNIARQLATPLYEQDMGRLYYTLMTLMAIALGVFGSVFNTYSMLYNAKDNDLLLSMPVPPRNILISRLAAAYFLGTIYEAVVFIPSIIAYPGVKKDGPAAIIFPVLLVFIIGFVILTLTCILGWLVALISSKTKKNNIVSVILSLVFLGGYYYLWMNLQKIISYVVTNSEAIDSSFSNKAAPLYYVGSAAQGNAIHFLLFTLFSLILLVITIAVMSRSFLSIVTKSTGGDKTKFRDKASKQQPAGLALLKKEYARFLGSANYMLNSGLGLIIMLAGTVALIVKHNAVLSLLQGPQFKELGIGFNPFVAAAVCMICGMNCISAPSISLEGSSVWIPKTIPVKPVLIFKAKEMLQFTLNIVPAQLLTVTFAAVNRAGTVTGLLMCVTVCIYNLLVARAGLMFNLLRPVLSWTNEALPIKQSMSVLLSIITGFVLSGITIGAYFALGRFTGEALFLAAVSAVYLAVTFILGKAIKTKGVKLFEEL